MSARLVIAAPRSGEGKTSVALGLAAALRARGLDVGSAKVGPDYLDTGWHTLATGRPARNLDVWTMGKRGVRESATRAAHGREVLVIEGVMGLFDGHRTDAAPCSTADVAALLDVPVILVVDASRAAASLAALALGFSAYDARVRVAGVVLNRFGAHRDRTAVQAAFDRVGIPVLGWIPPAENTALPSRHLGLVPSAEDERAALEAIEALGELVAEHVDVDALLEIARSAAPMGETGASEVVGAVASTVAPAVAEKPEAAESPRPRIAVARDDAFCFYYADSIDLLRALGAEIVEFSPLTDAALPEGVDGIYLGGGYPELHAERLSANATMRDSVAAASRAGMPVYGECGGMLYLLESLTGGDGTAHPMAGVLPARARLTDKLQRVGYVEASLAADCVLGDAGTVVRGHEFRYSECVPNAGAAPAWLVDGVPHGFVEGNTVASYLHLNFIGCPSVAASFVDACRAHAAGTEPSHKESA